MQKKESVKMKSDLIGKEQNFYLKSPRKSQVDLARKFVNNLHFL